MSEVWTNTADTDLDWKFVDKLIKYKGVLYLAQPLNAMDDIKKRNSSFVYTSLLNRIERDEKAIKKTFDECTPVMYCDNFSSVTSDKIDEINPYWNNGYFSGEDARFAYALAATRKPSKIVEIGVGNSTKFFRKAINDFSLDTKIVSIDPNPRANVNHIADQFIEKSVLDMDVNFFKELNPGDFLFSDGSHVVFNGTDTVKLFLEILPILPRGVFVHVHDIFIPFETMDNPVVGPVSHSEQYILATYLLNNDKTIIIAPIHYLTRAGKIRGWGSSFWFIT